MRPTKENERIKTPRKCLAGSSQAGSLQTPQACSLAQVVLAQADPNHASSGSRRLTAGIQSAQPQDRPGMEHRLQTAAQTFRLHTGRRRRRGAGLAQLPGKTGCLCSAPRGVGVSTGTQLCSTGGCGAVTRARALHRRTNLGSTAAPGALTPPLTPARDFRAQRPLPAPLHTAGCCLHPDGSATCPGRGLCVNLHF